MLFFLQTVSILSVFLATFIVFQSVGVRRGTLFYTREQKKEFEGVLAGYFGSYATVANILGTLTSLATVYVFFLGTSKVFGYFIFVCAIVLWFSHRITNTVTKLILENVPRVSELYKRSDQISAVIASLVWSNTAKGRLSAKIVKAISLSSISAILWLEFSIFADVSGTLLGLDDLVTRALIFFLCAFAILFFIFRYGLRGFVFADVFQAPLIVLGSALLLIGILLVIFESNIHSQNIWIYLRPVITLPEGLMFVFHVIILNLFAIVISEGHWLRVWIFGQREMTMQPLAVKSTSMTILILIIIGLLAAAFTQRVGNEGVADLLLKIQEVTGNPIFLCAFWVAATCALFSTTDAQIYSFLVVRAFDPSKGVLSTNSSRPNNDLLLSLGVSAFAVGSYLLVRHFGLPFEKLIFLIIPWNLNILPAFAAVMTKRPPSPLIMLGSLALYVLCGIAGLLQPQSNFFWTLTAALVPGVTFVTLILRGERATKRSSA
jgi:hypothetical protein